GHPDRRRRAVPAIEHHRIRRSPRRHREGRGLIRADVCASRAGIRGRHLHAAGAGRLVSERGEALGINRWPRCSTPSKAGKSRDIVRARGLWWTKTAGVFAANQLSAGYWTLLGLWGDTGAVHMAVLDDDAREIAVVTMPCPDGHFPSVGALHPPAIRLERAVRDLYGLEPVGSPDTRPGLALGCGDVRPPLGERGAAPTRRVPSPFLPAAGEALPQIPAGPVHAGIIEPGHFRFTANGETVVRLEQRLGYVHK